MTSRLINGRGEQGPHGRRSLIDGGAVPATQLLTIEPVLRKNSIRWVFQRNVTLPRRYVPDLPIAQPPGSALSLRPFWLRSTAAKSRIPHQCCGERCLQANRSLRFKLRSTRQRLDEPGNADHVMGSLAGQAGATPHSVRDLALEKHYSASELAQLWGLSEKSIRGVFSNEPVS
jgi:hypothetical protein